MVQNGRNIGAPTLARPRSHLIAIAHTGLFHAYSSAAYSKTFVARQLQFVHRELPSFDRRFRALIRLMPYVLPSAP